MSFILFVRWTGLLRGGLLAVAVAAPSVTHAQWIQQPGLQPGTSIPYPPQYVPPPTLPSPILMQPQPTQVVSDPLAPSSFLPAVPFETLSPVHKAYAQEFIALDELRVLSTWNGEVLRSSILPRQGIFQKPLPRAEFYDRIGGETLRSQYVSRSRQKIGLIAGGATGAGVGLLMAAISGVLLPTVLFNTDIARKEGKCPVYAPGGCGNRAIAAQATVLGIGSALLITGTVLFIAGLVKTADPIETPEARRLTMAFNEALRQRLGITHPAQMTPASVADKPGTGTPASQLSPPIPLSPTDQAAPSK
ncbi:MAG: hypothetical protein JNJ46_24725 [Myxococcales bacterium]|nr:hypothetical protein [Myxococcales bacterium]